MVYKNRHQDQALYVGTRYLAIFDDRIFMRRDLIDEAYQLQRKLKKDVKFALRREVSFFDDTQDSLLIARNQFLDLVLLGKKILGAIMKLNFAIKS